MWKLKTETIDNEEFKELAKRELTKYKEEYKRYKRIRNRRKKHKRTKKQWVQPPNNVEQHEKVNKRNCNENKKR